MRNIILALILAAPVAAFAADPNARLEASGSCIGCELRGASGIAASALQPIPVSTTTRTVASSGVTLPNMGSLAYQLGRLQTVKDITDENGVTGVGEGNGIVLSPCFVLTNQHQVYGANIFPDLKEERPMKYFFGKGEGVFRWQIEGRPHRVGGRTPDGANDWALLKMKTCVGKKTGYPELDLRSPAQLANTTLYFVSISPNAETANISQPVACKALGRDPITGTLLHNCPAGHGDSGGGLFSADGKLVAIIGGKNKSGPTAITMFNIVSDANARSIIQGDKTEFLLEQGQNPAISQALVTQGRSANI